jgi:hypothetical protein
MKVEILYFSGCPNHPPAVGRVREALQSEGVSAEMIEVEIKDAATARVVGFLGSPTIRINGRDVEPAARSAEGFGLTCRTYTDGVRRAGIPPMEWIRAAVQEAKGEAVLSVNCRSLQRWSLRHDRAHHILKLFEISAGVPDNVSLALVFALGKKVPKYSGTREIAGGR